MFWSIEKRMTMRVLLSGDWTEVMCVVCDEEEAEEGECTVSANYHHSHRTAMLLCGSQSPAL